MQHFPIFLDLADARVIVAGDGEAAVSKVRLLLKTGALLEVFAPRPSPALSELAASGRIRLHLRALAEGDCAGARLVYGATEDATEDARVAGIARTEGALVNIVDNLEASDYITPAIVDRDPVVVAIGTEGAAPVLARAIKQDLEARLPVALGVLARAGKVFRAAADALPMGRKRRDFWAEYYDTIGSRTLDQSGAAALEPALRDLLARHLAEVPGAGRVDLVGAGPGDPELMTLKARRLLDRADVVIHDRLVPGAILELARREAILIAVGKEGFGQSTPQSEINRLMVEHASSGAHVVRLKGGDPSVFGRLDEETEALDAAGIDWAVVPGITAASASAAALGQSLTQRGRNASARLVTGHDMQGYAEQDWQALALPGAVAAVYMGKRAARFIQGRMLMHGASPQTPVSVIENASRPDQRVISATLASLPQVVADLVGPAVLLLGIAPRSQKARRLEAAL